MIYKVLYQEDKIANPKREETKTLFIDTLTSIEARELVEKNTPYNVELIQELTGNSLEYEKKSPDFKLTEFPK